MEDQDSSNVTEMQIKEAEVDQNHIFWTHFDGFSYSDFGRTETVSHWKLTGLFEAGHYYFLSKKGLLALPSAVDQTKGIFLYGVIYHIDPTFWQIPRNKSFPFKISQEICDIGKTSVTLAGKLVNKLDNKVLATDTCKLVYVDQASGRSQPLPDWVSQKDSSFVTEKHVLHLQKQPFEVPDEAFCYNVTVAASDTDYFKHTNQGSYLRFLCDAAQAAILAQRLTGFKVDIACYPLRVLEAVYVGQSKTGDTLSVWLWQQDRHPGHLHYIIKHEDNNNKGSAVCYGFMEYDTIPLKSRL